MDTILPLTYKERKSLIEMTSMKLVWSEWRHIFSSSVFLLFSTLHLCGILMADFSLFWILSKIYFYGSRETGIENEGKTFLCKIEMKLNFNFSGNFKCKCEW